MSKQVEVTIEGLGAQGDGIATLDGGKVYVPLTLVGETITVDLKGKQGDGLAGRLRDVVQASADRVEAQCKHFSNCGGCSLQHMEPSAYLDFKTQLVRRALDQRGLDDVQVAPAQAFPAHTRRRVKMAAWNSKSGVMLGFRQRRGDHIVNVSGCTIAAPSIEAMFEPLRALMADILPINGRATVTMTAMKAGVDLMIDAGLGLDLPLRENLAAFALEVDIARLTWKHGDNEEPVIMQRAPVVTFGDIKVALPTSVFLQASAESEEALINYVVENVGDASRVADLFSGVGTYSFPLAQKAMVDAFDVDVNMVEAARRALPTGHDAPRLTSKRRDLFREPLTAPELSSYDVVVLDPPRAGAKAQCAELAKSDVPDIVMVSCNPATFARDARTLVDGGYTLEMVRPVDQFLWSAHVELVATFYQ